MQCQRKKRDGKRCRAFALAFRTARFEERNVEAVSRSARSFLAFFASLSLDPLQVSQGRGVFSDHRSVKGGGRMTTRWTCLATD